LRLLPPNAKASLLVHPAGNDLLVKYKSRKEKQQQVPCSNPEKNMLVEAALSITMMTMLEAGENDTRTLLARVVMQGHKAP
jgi:hypothetical protein